MGTIILRSALEPGGFLYDPDRTVPADLARIVDGRIVTWAEIHARRGEDQRRRVAWKRGDNDLPGVLPCYVWTFYNRQAIPYGGWWCYVVTRHFDIGVNFRGFEKDLAESIMRAVPCGLLPCEDNFYRWMEAFAKQYPRPKRTRDRRKAGSIVGWLHDRRRFTLERASAH